MNETIEQYNIYDLGFNKFLSRIDSDFGAIKMTASGDLLSIPSILGSGFYEVPPSQIGSGEIGGNLTMIAGLLQSANYVSGITGWIIRYNGDIEFNSGTFRGTLIAGSIHIPDENTTANSFHTDSSGNTWWGCTHTLFDADNNNATAYILKTGAGKLSNLILTGLQAGSEVDGLYLKANTVVSGAVNVALREWTCTCVFSSSDYNTVAWAAGTFTASDGTSYSISGGNTGNMSARTYIYLDTAVSTTVFQTTTTASTAVGNGKVLIAVAENNSDTTSDAIFQVFGGYGGQTLLVDSIAANSASTNEFISNTAQIANAIITDAKISTLSVAKLLAGSITSKAIILAVSDGSGDSYIAAGKTDFTNAVSGVILGIDDSDSNKAKFYIGDASVYFNWDAANLTVVGGTITGGTIQTSSNNPKIILSATGDDLKLIDANGNTLIALSDSASDVLGFTAVKAGQGFILNNVDTLNYTGNLLEVAVKKAGSSGRAIYATNVGSGSVMALTALGTGRVLDLTGNGHVVMKINDASNIDGSLLIDKDGGGSAINIDIDDDSFNCSAAIVINNTNAGAGFESAFGFDGSEAGIAGSGNGGFVSNSKGTFTLVGFIRVLVASNVYYVPYGTYV